MTGVPLKAAQRDLMALVRAVEEDGERIVLTRRGRPVAALLPVGAIAGLHLLGRLLPDVADVAAGFGETDRRPRAWGRPRAPRRRRRDQPRPPHRRRPAPPGDAPGRRPGRPGGRRARGPHPPRASGRRSDPLDLLEPLPPGALRSPLSAALGSPPADESPAATQSPEAS